MNAFEFGTPGTRHDSDFRGDRGVSELLVAVDGREASMRALSFAADRAERAGDSLHVVHVSSESEAAAEQMHDRVDDALAGVDVEARVEFVERAGSSKTAVGDQLLDLVSAGDYAMLVLGNEPDSAVREFIVGSVGKQVVEARSVPVLLVP